MLESIKRRLANLNDNVAFGGLFVIAGISVWLSLQSNPDGATPGWISGLFQNLGSGIVGALVTYYLFDRIIQRRADDEQSIRDKERFIGEISSSDNVTCLNAFRQPEAPRWLRDGSLRNRVFSNVNWQGADLSGADFRGSVITDSNLRDVDLTAAKLDGTSFDGSDLRGAKGLDTAFLGKIGMPDGDWYERRSDRVGNSGFSRFTDPTHPHFWRSDNPNSPAYRAPSD